MKRSFILSLLCLVLSGLAEAQYLYGLDPTFANNGIYQGDTGRCSKIAVQQDGKIIMAGGERQNSKFITAMRFNSDGSVDNSFADNGYYISHVVDRVGSSRLNTVCLQPDGKILLGGTIDTGFTSDDFFLIRLKPDGSPDSSFGGAGYVITGYPSSFGPGSIETIRSIIVQPDGKIVAYGLYEFGMDSLQVVRYHTDGRLDSSFGVNGRVEIADSSWHHRATDVALMPDGRIVLGAEAVINALSALNVPVFMAIRLLADGSFDTGFNHSGIFYTNDNLSGLLYCTDMALQPDGKVLLAGYVDSIVILRLDTSGRPDNSFGSNGMVKLDPAGKAVETIVQPDGKIVLGTNPDGWPYPDTCYAIYRIMPDGSTDNSFGINGKVLTKTVNVSNMLGAIALQPDGKLVAGGGYYLGTNLSRLMVTRYNQDATSSVSTVYPQNDIIVYPTPADSYIYIQNNSTYTIRNVALYSIDGVQLRVYNIPGSDRLSTDGLADGVYYLRIQLSNTYRLTQKVIIQKN